MFVSPAGSVKLGDFTGYHLDHGAPEPVAGLKHQAPELLDPRQGVPSPSSDLYCLGWTALVLLIGDRVGDLFAAGDDPGVDAEAWARWHADPARDLPPLKDALQGVPEQLVDIVQALVEKDPAKRRYLTARAALEDLTRHGLRSQRPLLHVAPAPPARGSDPELTLPPAEPENGLARTPPPPAPAPAPAPSPLRLRFEDNGQSRDVAFEPDRSVLVGQNGACELQLAADRVANKHALIVCQADGWWVYDLHSDSGTAVNGERVTRAKLGEGDTVNFADVSCNVVQAPAGASAPKAPPAKRKPAAPAKPDAAIFGKFRLLEKIHEGRSGQLFRAAWAEKPERPQVALRVFPASFQYEGEQVRRFLRGIPDAARFRHPNIVRLYRGGNVLRGKRHVWYLAMEFMPGGSLRDRLRKEKTLRIRDAVRFALDIAKALEAVTAAGRLHRNVNPACILFDKAGVAKLGDFFLLRAEAQDLMNQITQANLPPGEHIYQAPELIQGPSSNVGIESDLYSLTASLYEALTGRPPFKASDDLPDTLAKILQDPVPSPARLNPSLPPTLSDFLLKGLSKKPGMRFKSPSAFREALLEAVEDPNPAG
jgi:serine/threonine protein kinase